MSIRRSKTAKRNPRTRANSLFANFAGSSTVRKTHALEHLESRCMMAVDTSNMSSATLNIYIDGTRVAIPANVGVNANDTHASVFTTAADGKIFFENTNVTLGNFFDTWRTNAGLAGNNANAILSSSQVMNAIEDRDSHLQLFVNGQLSEDFANQDIDAGDSIVLVYSSNTVVSLNTNFGAIVIELFDDETPGTVANFLNYVNDGDYINSFFHRSAKLQNGEDFVIQGGGFRTNSTTFTNTSQFSNVPTDPPIQNEPGISNKRGTVAMAKTSDPNSATSQFFVNLNDENDFLDNPNNSGGFTVFGQVLDMTIADTIADIPVRTNNSAPYGELPVNAQNQLAVVQSVEGEGEVNGFKFNDVDGDGVKDAGEQGIAGITVFVDANNNGAFDTGEISTTTASDGFYELHLDPGSYKIRAVLSSGTHSTTTNVDTVIEIGDKKVLNFGENATAIPSAGNDTYSVNEDAVLTVPVASGVLVNDTDPENNSLTAQVVAQPNHGTVTLNADGSFTYTPTANFFGTDTFTYIAKDSTTQSAPATVTITVSAQPDAPSAVDDVFTTSRDSGAKAISVLTNDTTSPDATQTLTITTVTQGSNGGAVAISGSNINYTPATGFTGTETFTYTIQDTDGLTDTATVTVTVENVSDTNSISGFVYIDKNKNGVRDTGEAGLPGSLIRMTGADTVGNPINRTAISDNTGAFTFTVVRSGTYKLTQQQPEATTDGAESTTVAGAITTTNDQISNIVVTANNNFTGNNFGEKYIKAKNLSIAWLMNWAPSKSELARETVAKAEEKAGGSDLATAIRANAPELANRAPTTVNDTYTIIKGGTLNVNAANGVLKNDSDVDGNTLTAEVITGPTNGTLTLNADGSFTYKPNATFTGTDTVTYRAKDGSLTKNGTITFTVNMTGNVAPQAANDTYNTTEDVTLTINAATGVLNNDTDADGQPLTAAIVTQPAHGAVTLNADGSFTYVPTANYNGPDSFTYRTNDGITNSANATVNITVAAVADAPVAANDSYSVSEDQELDVSATNGVKANDGDPDGDTLSDIVVVTTTTHGTLTTNGNGSFKYVPNQHFFGTDTFTYQISDGTTTDTATVTITVTATPDSTVAGDDAYTVGEDQPLEVTIANSVRNNDSDLDGDFTVQVVTQPSHGTLVNGLSDAGTFIYQPNAGFVGTDTFTYEAKDDNSSTTATVTITVVANEVPVGVANSYSIDEDGILNVNAADGVLADDTDADPNTTLTAVLVVDSAHGDLTFNSDGSFTYSPDDNYAGTDTFTYRAKDQYSSSEITTVTITVNPINDAPVPVADSYSMTEGQVLTTTIATGILANDSDPEGNAMTVSLVQGQNVTNGTLTLNVDGTFTYTPTNGFVGTDSFQYVATDGILTSAATTVQITVADEEQGLLASIDEVFEDEEDWLLV